MQRILAKRSGRDTGRSKRRHRDHAALRLLERQNTVQIKVDTEAAVTVQIIYSLYLQGCGQKRYPQAQHYGAKDPGALRAERCSREVRQTHKTRDGQFLWTYASVKNILVEEAYTGVLNNHRREYNNGKAKHIDKTDWYRR